MNPRPATCPHELRPGTKVCLHCRRAEREANAARQRAILMRVGLTGAAIAAVAYAGFVGFRAWQGKGSPSIGSLLASPASLEAAPVRALTVSAPGEASTAPVTNPTAVDSSAVRPDSAAAAATVPVGADAGLMQPVAQGPGAPASASVAPQTEAMTPPITVPPSAPVAPPVAAPVVPPTPVVPPLQPVVAEGRTELQNGIYALRRGDTVTVHFDTPEARTRRPEKFEQIVRATLPAVHGAAAASILASIASGNLVGPAETITEPQAGGIALRGGDGRTLSVLPQTRPGRDGPLVVAYRVIPAR